MVEDATFEDGDEKPVRLIAQEVDDLSVVSTLLQDAVAQTNEMRFERKQRRFSLLLNRFRWEDHDRARQLGRPFERVQTVLSIEDVLNVQAQEFDPSDKDLVLALLGVSFEPGKDGAGRVILTFSGDGALALDVECIDMQLKDVSRPYVARAKGEPTHPLD